MVEVGGLVARACDQLVGNESATSKSVEELVRQSRASKARLLHYVSLFFYVTTHKLTRLSCSLPDPIPFSIFLRHPQYPILKAKRLTIPGAVLTSITLC